MGQRAPTTLTLIIEGVDLPGRSCAPPGAAEGYGNVHVGVQRGGEVVDLFPGDSDAARWSVPVTVKALEEGPDFGGPFVHGRRGDRFLYLSWGVVDGDEFRMFRRAKLHLADAGPEVLAAAVAGGTLRCRVQMTDASGNPRCARVRPPEAMWSGASS